MFKHFILTAALLATFTLSSCGTDEPETSDAPSDNTEHPGTDPGAGGDTPGTGGEDPGSDEPRENPITVNADGTTSTGAPFRRIDDTTFWLNYVKYHIVDGHIAVIGRDDTEIEHTLKGEVALYSNITIDCVTYAVREIEVSAFSRCDALKVVHLPYGLTEIKGVVNENRYDSGAFAYCKELTNVTFPNYLQTIGNDAFFGCTSITAVMFSTSLQTIGKQAFYKCTSLTSITFPNSLQSIGDEAFTSCASLTSVSFPNSLKTIGTGAFYNCTSLSSVIFPNSLQTIGNEAFYNCSSLKSVIFPNSLQTIGNEAFYNCSSLKSVIFPNSLQTIGNEAFYNCSSLKSITFAVSNPSMGSKVFANNRNLEYIIIIDDKNHTFSSRLDGKTYNYSIFTNCDKLRLFYMPDEMTIVGKFKYSNDSSSDYHYPEYFIAEKIFCHTLSYNFDYIDHYSYRLNMDYGSADLYYPAGCSEKYSKVYPEMRHFEFDPTTFNYLDLLAE